MGTISLKKARKAFGDTVIIPGADLDIKNGEFHYTQRPLAKRPLHQQRQIEYL